MWLSLNSHKNTFQCFQIIEIVIHKILLKKKRKKERKKKIIRLFIAYIIIKTKGQSEFTKESKKLQIKNKKSISIFSIHIMPRNLL